MNWNKNSQEWLKQAEYDLETAQIMLQSGRYIYCVFMCHLSLEKALKSLYVKNLAKSPPKVHSLVYLAKSTNLELSQKMKEFLEELDEISVPTRYPQDLDSLLIDYSKEKTQVIFDRTKEVFEWLKKKSLQQ